MISIELSPSLQIYFLKIFFSPSSILLKVKVQDCTVVLPEGKPAFYVKNNEKDLKKEYKN